MNDLELPSFRASVLVVDDDDDLRDSLKELLQLSGYPVETAHHGRAALDFLDQRGPPCLVLLDLMMPVMDGWQFLDTVRRHPQPATANVPVALLSALRPEAEDLKRRYGCEVLGKPVDIEALLRTALRHCAMP